MINQPTARIPVPSFTTASATTTRDELYEELVRLRIENARLKQTLWSR